MTFPRFPARSIFQADLGPGKMTRESVEKRIDERIKKIPRESVVRIRVTGDMNWEMRALLSAGSLRSIFSERTNVDVRFKPAHSSG